MAKRWTEQENQYLKDNIGAFPIGIIAKRLNRSETSCVVKAKRVKAGTFSKHTDMFTIKEAAQQEETNYLITMFYFGKTYREIGEKLGRSESSVKHRMQRIEYGRKLQNVDLYNG